MFDTKIPSVYSYFALTALSTIFGCLVISRLASLDKQRVYVAYFDLAWVMMSLAAILTGFSAFGEYNTKIREDEVKNLKRQRNFHLMNIDAASLVQLNCRNGIPMNRPKSIDALNFEILLDEKCLWASDLLREIQTNEYLLDQEKKICNDEEIARELEIKFAGFEPNPTENLCGLVKIGGGQCGEHMCNRYQNRARTMNLYVRTPADARRDLSFDKVYKFDLRINSTMNREIYQALNPLPKTTIVLSLILFSIALGLRLTKALFDTGWIKKRNTI